jgi:membrane-associated protease RseP (regulator of RpoE activity)
MNRRWLWIILGVIGFFGVLCAGVVAGVGATYLFLQNRMVRSGIDLPLRDLPFRIEPFGGRSEEILADKAAFLIIDVVSNSPAEEAGLETGDLIVSIDGEIVQLDQSLAEVIQAYQPGDQITFDVMRSGEEETREFEVTLGEHPDDPEQAYLGVNYNSVPNMALWEKGNLPSWRFMAPEFREDMGPMFGLPFDKMPFSHDFPPLPEGIDQAVIIGEVTEASPADQAGLEAGDVITAVDGEPVEGVEPLVDLVQSKEPGDEITLTVYRSGEQDPLEINVTLAENPDAEGQTYLGVSISGFINIENSDPNSPDAFRFDFDQLPWPGEIPEVDPGEQS